MCTCVCGMDRLALTRIVMDYARYNRGGIFELNSPWVDCLHCEWRKLRDLTKFSTTNLDCYSAEVNNELRKVKPSEQVSDMFERRLSTAENDNYYLVSRKYEISNPIRTGTEWIFTIYRPIAQQWMDARRLNHEIAHREDRRRRWSWTPRHLLDTWDTYIDYERMKPGNTDLRGIRYELELRDTRFNQDSTFLK